MSSQSLTAQYAEEKPLLSRIERRVKGIIDPFCEEQKFLFEGRIKSQQSVAEKLETGRFSSWNDLDDLYACSVIVNLPEDEPIVQQYLQDSFSVSSELSRFRGQQNKAADVFRYDSTRVVCNLRKPAHIEEITRLYEIKFEVQIRTIFDYAWSKTTHALAYKSPVVSWKRLRLAAQLKAATEQIETLILAFEQASEVIETPNDISVEEQAKIHSFFKKLFDDKKLVEELEPEGWSLFSDNVHIAF